MISSSTDQWRRRLLILRGILVATLAFVALFASMRGVKLISPAATLLWLSLLWLPSVWYWPTRQAAISTQTNLLSAELLFDSLIFLSLMYTLGGSANPLTFYLLIPILVAALSLPASACIFITTVNIAGYGALLYWFASPTEHSSLHAITHQMHSLHGQGMWLAFSLVAIALTLLGRALQKARQQESAQQSTALALALQRERMYQLAGSLADRAHELNTPLSTLLLMLEEVSENVGPAHPVHPQLIQSQQLALRMAQVLKSEIENSQSDQPKPLSELCIELHHALRLIAPALAINFIDNANPMLSPTIAWQRILLNVGYNASDAGATELHIECVREAKHFLIQCSDNGPRHQGSQREGLGVGLALIETTLATLQGEINYRFDHQWTQVLIRVPLNSIGCSEVKTRAMGNQDDN